MKNRSLNHKDDWATPDYILKPLIEKWGAMFDPCPLHHDVRDWDGLEIEWGDVNFVNPPYSLKLKTAFVKKAIEESKKDKVVIMLLPVSTSTKLFHDLIKPNCEEITFLKGRVKFVGKNTKGEQVSNKCGMHDSMLVYFGASNCKFSNSVNYEIDRETEKVGAFYADSNRAREIVAMNERKFIRI